MTGAAGSVYDAVGSMGGYVASWVWYSLARQGPKYRPMYAQDGPGIVLPPLPHKRLRFEHMTTEEKERFKWERRNDSSSSEEPTVAHAIGGKRIKRAETDVEEVWFAGAHADVGGGSVKNGERYSFPRISLRWMVRQCFKCDTGIMFHANVLEDIGLSPETLWPKVLPRPPLIRSFDEIPFIPQTSTLVSQNPEPNPPAYSTLPSNADGPGSNAAYPGYQDAPALDPNDPRNPTQTSVCPVAKSPIENTPNSRAAEEVEDLKDALSPIYDQLMLNWWWWILEIILVKQVWRSCGTVSLQSISAVPGSKRNGVNVHRAVQLRMSARKDLDGKPLTYNPHAWLKLAWVKWLGGAEGVED